MIGLDRWARENLPRGIRKNAARTVTRTAHEVPIGNHPETVREFPFGELRHADRSDCATFINALSRLCDDWGAPEGMNPVVGHGDPYARVLVVGRAPGYSECRNRRAFSGRAATFVNRMLAHQGVRLTPDGGAFATNASAFFSPSGEEPSRHALAASAPVVHALMSAIKPLYIIVCGRQAAKVILGNTGKSIEELRGYWRTPTIEAAPWRSQVWPVDVRVTYHPLYVLRDENRRTAKARMDFDSVGVRLAGHARPIPKSRNA